MIWIVILIFGIVGLSFILDGILSFFAAFLSGIFLVLLVLVIMGILHIRKTKKHNKL